MVTVNGFETLLSAGAKSFGLVPTNYQYDTRVEGIGAAALFLLVGLHPEALLPWMEVLFTGTGMFELIFSFERLLNYCRRGWRQHGHWC